MKVRAGVLQSGEAGPDGLTLLHEGQYYTLDHVSSVGWQALVSGGDIEAAVDAVINVFDVGRTQAENDMTAFLEHLVRVGLIEF